VASQLGIPDGSITLAKLAAGILTADTAGRAKMADGYVTAEKIADATITAGKLDVSLAWPAGLILPYGGESVPTGWLECNGASVLRSGTSGYPALFTAIGTLHGTADGTHFNVPDMRGYFVRGWDHGAGNDPNAGTRTAGGTGGATGDHVGTVQADELKAHTHNYKVTLTSALGGSGARMFNSGGTTLDPTDSTGGSETRPKNKAAMFIIKT
jgi:microcystin-dependent protein